MIDTRTQQPIQVLVNGTAIPYMRITADLLDRVSELLRRHQVDHRVESNRISIDDRPAIGVINLSRKADPSLVQQLLNDAN